MCILFTYWCYKAHLTPAATNEAIIISPLILSQCYARSYVLNVIIMNPKHCANKSVSLFLDRLVKTSVFSDTSNFHLEIYKFLFIRMSSSAANFINICTFRPCLCAAAYIQDIITLCIFYVFSSLNCSRIKPLSMYITATDKISNFIFASGCTYLFRFAT